MTNIVRLGCKHQGTLLASVRAKLLTRASNAVGVLVKANVGTAHGTAQDNVFFVYSVVACHRYFSFSISRNEFYGGRCRSFLCSIGFEVISKIARGGFVSNLKDGSPRSLAVFNAVYHHIPKWEQIQRLSQDTGLMPLTQNEPFGVASWHALTRNTTALL